jgi:hypothetical protein
LFAESINKDENVVEPMLVFSEGAVVHCDMFPWSRRNGERMEESGLLIPGDLDSSAGMTVTAILLDCRRDSVPPVLRREHLDRLLSTGVCCGNSIMDLSDEEGSEVIDIRNQKAAVME